MTQFREHAERARRAKAEEKRKRELRALELRNLVKPISPMVRRLLKEVGKECFGKTFLFFDNFEIIEKAKPYGHSWELKGPSSGVLKRHVWVNLMLYSKGNLLQPHERHFTVIPTGNQRNLNRTPDLSGEHLRDFLKEATYILVRRG